MFSLRLSEVSGQIKETMLDIVLQWANCILTTIIETLVNPLDDYYEEVADHDEVEAYEETNDPTTVSQEVRAGEGQDLLLHLNVGDVGPLPDDYVGQVGPE